MPKTTVKKKKKEVMVHSGTCPDLSLSVECTFSCLFQSNQKLIEWYITETGFSTGSIHLFRDFDYK